MKRYRRLVVTAEWEAGSGSAAVTVEVQQPVWQGEKWTVLEGKVEQWPRCSVPSDLVDELVDWWLAHVRAGSGCGR